MTKTVRIENADNSNWPVRVTTQIKDPETGEWKDQQFQQLNHPTALFQDYLTSTRRFVVEERPQETPVVVPKPPAA